MSKILLCNVSYIKDMTTYHLHGVKLSIGQKDKLARALRNNSAITIRSSNSELTGPDQLMLTKTQINRLKKAMQNKTFNKKINDNKIT